MCIAVGDFLIDKTFNLKTINLKENFTIIFQYGFQQVSIVENIWMIFQHMFIK